MSQTNAAQNFANRLVGSRLVNLYMKIMGLTVLDATTMVPFSLLLGRDVFEEILNGGDEQMGGKFLEDLYIPIMDDPYIGSFLVLLGITTLQPTTLIPLGLVATIYELYVRDLV